ncbi:MAG: divergent PAP2 family protein [Firmicutes bacterium]|nr:divergent PAP2 family protein [Alicyclobacillaceae bacterium]MCL6496686.1 divergent PAP2 family protein [Bacillota bacterium]
MAANPVLTAAVGAALSAQVLKFLLFYWRRRRARWERLVGPGGMPSAHAAMVSALAAGTARRYGPQSAAFAVAAVVALIVLYDAVGVRRAVGIHAQALNRLARDGERRLSESVGHTPYEVLVGTLWGIAWALWL